MLMKKKAEQTETHENMGSTAMDDLNRAIELNPKSAVDYSARALLKSDEGDFQGAIEDLSKAIEIRPDNAFDYMHRGITKGEAGDLSGALKDLDSAITLNPEFAEAYSERALIKTLKQRNSEVLKN